MLMADVVVVQQVTPHLGAGAVAGRLFVVLLLVLANSFFVAAEFALVAVRRTRIDEMAQGGDRKARTVQGALDPRPLYRRDAAGHYAGVAGAGMGR